MNLFKILLILLILPSFLLAEQSNTNNLKVGSPEKGYHEIEIRVDLRHDLDLPTGIVEANRNKYVNIFSKVEGKNKKPKFSRVSSRSKLVAIKSKQNNQLLCVLHVPNKDWKQVKHSEENGRLSLGVQRYSMEHVDNFRAGAPQKGYHEIKIGVSLRANIYPPSALVEFNRGHFVEVLRAVKLNNEWRVFSISLKSKLVAVEKNKWVVHVPIKDWKRAELHKGQVEYSISFLGGNDKKKGNSYIKDFEELFPDTAPLSIDLEDDTHGLYSPEDILKKNGNKTIDLLAIVELKSKKTKFFTVSTSSKLVGVHRIENNLFNWILYYPIEDWRHVELARKCGKLKLAVRDSSTKSKKIDLNLLEKELAGLVKEDNASFSIPLF